MLKIYGVPISVHTRKVIVAARLKRLPFELRAGGAGDSRQPAAQLARS